MNTSTMMVEREVMKDGEVKVTLEVGMATKGGTFKAAGREEVVSEVVGKTTDCRLAIPSSLNLPLLVGVGQTGEEVVEGTHCSHLTNQTALTWTPDRRTLPHIER